MQERIVINGKGYPTKEITFNTVCQFEDIGVPMSDIEAKSIMFSAIIKLGFHPVGVHVVAAGKRFLRVIMVEILISFHLNCSLNDF